MRQIEIEGNSTKYLHTTPPNYQVIKNKENLRTATDRSSCFLELSVELRPLERTVLLPKDLESAHYNPQWLPQQAGVRDALVLVLSPLEVLAGSAITYCITLNCVISSQSCGGPSCHETDT